MAAPPAGRGESYRLGLVLVASAGLLWSLGGLFFRMIDEATVWQIVAGRTFFLASSCALLLLWRHGRGAPATFRRMGRWGLVGACGIAIANTLFMFALEHTYVANAVFMLAAAPVLAAGLGWLLLREPVRPATAAAMAGVAAGLAAMVSGGLGTDRWLGDVLAAFTVMGFALAVVALRAGRFVEMLPCIVLGATMAALFATAMAFAGGEGLAMTPADLFWCAMMGIVQLTFGMALFVAGSKHVPAGELALLTLTETVFAPVWVWWFLGELPVAATFWGGGIVLAAIAANALTGLGRRPPPPATRSTDGYGGHPRP